MSHINHDEVKINVNNKTEQYKESVTPECKNNNSSRIFRKARGVTLRWKDVHLEVDVKNEKKSQKNQIMKKTILKNMAGEAKPGELLVLMGPSGAGKSSLLDCLANRNTNYTGEITVNGTEWNKSISNIASYVLQDDLFYPTLTVKEHLLYQAELRLGSETYTRIERELYVDEIIDSIGLKKCENTFIGGEGLRGISGGERKRLSVATELITNPSLLFVDEPTSGLDSYMAEAVINILKKLAKDDGRTIIATIHQPSSEIFELFDKLLLLSDGQLCYLGDANTAVKYFQSINFHCPQYSNPSDYFMRILSNNKDLEVILKSWVQKPISECGENEQAELIQLQEEYCPLSIKKQIYVLGRRNWTRLVKNKIAFGARIGQNGFLSILCGLIYLQVVNKDENRIQNVSGVLFFITVNRVFGDASPEFLLFPLELPIILREYRSGLYYVFTWFFAKNVSELVLQVCYPIFFLIPLYFMVGFAANVELFFSFVVIIIALSSCATGFGYFVACAAGNPQIASILGPVMILPFLLFGGLFLNANSIPDYFIWLEYLSPIKYGYEAFMRQYWITRGDEGWKLLQTLGLDKREFFESFIILTGINIGFRIMACLALIRYCRNNL